MVSPLALLVSCDITPTVHNCLRLVNVSVGTLRVGDREVEVVRIQGSIYFNFVPGGTYRAADVLARFANLRQNNLIPY